VDESRVAQLLIVNRIGFQNPRQLGENGIGYLFEDSVPVRVRCQSANNISNDTATTNRCLLQNALRQIGDRYQYGYLRFIDM